MHFKIPFWLLRDAGMNAPLTTSKVYWAYFESRVGTIATEIFWEKLSQRLLL
jgi:hypothetical protein